jgi:hypothetical protein
VQTGQEAHERSVKQDEEDGQGGGSAGRVFEGLRADLDGYAYRIEAFCGCKVEQPTERVQRGFSLATPQLRRRVLEDT